MNADQEKRVKLAAAYRILAMMKMDDLTYTHLSVRSSNGSSFFIYPFGMLFSEVTASSLLEVTLDGDVISGNERQYNKTGYVIHGNVYKARKDINAIFHLHTPAGVAVSIDKRGLMPVSQFALHLYNGISYHKYDSLKLENNQAQKLITDLGSKNFVMILENHGTLTAGRTIEEAMFYTYHLEQACKIQTLLKGLNEKNIISPSKAICEKTNKEILGFEKNLGQRDWAAHIRQLEREAPDYKN